MAAAPGVWHNRQRSANVALQPVPALADGAFKRLHLALFLSFAGACATANACGSRTAWHRSLGTVGLERFSV